MELLGLSGDSLADLTIDVKALMSRLQNEAKCSCYADGGEVFWCDYCQAEQLITLLISDLSDARSRIVALEQALKPFAAIKPSSFNAEDGSEREGYNTILSRNLGPDKPAFTGMDLARARFVLNQESVKG